MFTTLVAAVVLAVPKLALYFAALLSFFLLIFYLPFVLISAFFSEAKDQQLDVENNRMFVVLTKFHFWNMIVLLVSIFAIFTRTLLESGVKSFFSG